MSYIMLTWLLAPIWWPLSLLRRMLNPTPKRIVIFEIAGIGDVVCSAHLFEQLRVRYPSAEIDLVIDPVAASLTAALPMINRVIHFPYARQRGFMGRLRLAQCCIGYDTAICLIPSAAQLVAFCLAAVPRRFSVLPAPLNTSYRSLRPLLSRVSIHQPGAYFIKTQADLCCSLGLIQADATKKLAWNGGSKEPTLQPNTIGILVGSGRELKRMSTEQITSLIQGLLADPVGFRIVLIGGAADQASAQSVLQQIAVSDRMRIDDLTGRYTLAELPGMIKQLHLMIGVDSGVMHMADALGVPILCIAGPVDLHEVYQPGVQRVLLASNLACYPCSRVFDTPAECHLGHRKCLQSLDMALVVAKVCAQQKVSHA